MSSEQDLKDQVAQIGSYAAYGFIGISTILIIALCVSLAAVSFVDDEHAGLGTAASIFSGMGLMMSLTLFGGTIYGLTVLNGLKGTPSPTATIVPQLAPLT